MIGSLAGRAIGTRIAAAIGGAMLFVIIALSLWGWRLDTLRGGYKAALGQANELLATVTLAIPAAERPRNRQQLPDAVGRLVRERDNARGVVKIQSDSINAYAAETKRLARLGDENRKLAEATVRERDAWIQRAKAAETRTERLSAELELEECNAVLDALYRAGF